MTKNNYTRRALLSSVISLLLCITMLIGSTFAWFTDTATTKVNTIQAGELDIQLLDGDSTSANSLEGETLTFAKDDNAPTDEAVLFEPGAKYTLQQAWLYNAGNLHAKYQVVITGVTSGAELAQVLDVYVNDVNCGTLANLVALGGIVKEGTIEPGAFETFGKIDLKMKEEAGNEYQGMILDGVAITVLATQASAEFDSYGNKYDENASKEVIFIESQNDLENAVKAAAVDELTEIVLADKVTTYTFDSTLADSLKGKNVAFVGTEKTVFQYVGSGNDGIGVPGASLTFDGVTIGFPNDNYKGLSHTVELVYRNCVINGTQTLYAENVEFDNCEFNVSGDNYNVWTYGSSNVIFTDCEFNSDGKSVLVYIEGEIHSNVTLNACTFNDNGGLNEKKGAVEIGSSPYSDATTYNIYMNSCTVNGFAENDKGIPTGSTFWGNKNSMDKDHLNVEIDGVDVY